MHNLIAGYLILVSALFRDSESKTYTYSRFNSVIILGAYPPSFLFSLFRCRMLHFYLFFFFLSHQAWEVKSGSHGVQQQPVLQGQPFPLQVEYTTRQYDWWQGGQDTAENPQLEAERGVPRRCGLLAFCAATSALGCPEDRTDTSLDRGHRGENDRHYHLVWAVNLSYGQDSALY